MTAIQRDFIEPVVSGMDPSTVPSQSVTPMQAFASAARGLRDAELNLRRAQADYRLALDVLNKHVAPIPVDSLMSSDK